MDTDFDYPPAYEQLRQRVQELEEETLWQARKRSDVITERDALHQRVAEQLETIKALNSCIGGEGSTTTENLIRVSRLEQRVAELEENWRLSEIASAKRQMNVVKLTAERDALKQQRDELLAALGSGGRHCNDDTPHSNLCEAIIDSKEADLGQGLDPFWKWAFRRGFHEAETSYKVDITTLEQQRDELLAALESNQSRGVRDVIVERRRQINIEGWSSHHDDQHSYGEMALAAGCYAMFGLCSNAGDPPKYWPWDEKWWKPSDKRRNLVKAAALIIAEIERIDRAAIASVKEK